MNIVEFNSNAWDHLVKNKNRWTIPVTNDEIGRARFGDFSIVLTPELPVPRSWFPQLLGLKILALASGGGQQVPILAAAGAEVTVLDNSRAQLQQDQMVANKNGLTIRTVQGDMANLNDFIDESFDLIFHPCSNCFAPSLIPVWSECSRVLKKDGVIMWGFTKAESYLVVNESFESDHFVLKYKMPYSDIESLSDSERERLITLKEPMIFGHSLNQQIGELLRNGFQLTDLYEDDWGGQNPLDQYFKSFVAARAVKM